MRDWNSVEARVVSKGMQYESSGSREGADRLAKGIGARLLGAAVLAAAGIGALAPAQASAHEHGRGGDGFIAGVVAGTVLSGAGTGVVYGPTRGVVYAAPAPVVVYAPPPPVVYAQPAQPVYAQPAYPQAQPYAQAYQPPPPPPPPVQRTVEVNPSWNVAPGCTVQGVDQRNGQRIEVCLNGSEAFYARMAQSQAMVQAQALQAPALVLETGPGIRRLDPAVGYDRDHDRDRDHGRDHANPPRKPSKDQVDSSEQARIDAAVAKALAARDQAKPSQAAELPSAKPAPVSGTAPSPQSQKRDGDAR